MFTALHALAQNSTLMIVIAAEADELRVSITPTQADDKNKAHKLRPLSLVASPEELDAGFVEAIQAWQAPKRSLLQQAQDASAEAAPAAAPAKEKEPAAASGAKVGDAAPAPHKSNAGRPRKDTAAPGAPAAHQDDGAADVGAARPVDKQDGQAPSSVPPALAAAVDTVTLDMFAGGKPAAAAPDHSAADVALPRPADEDHAEPTLAAQSAVPTPPAPIAAASTAILDNMF